MFQIPPPPQCLSHMHDICPVDWQSVSRVHQYWNRGANSYSPAPFVYIFYPQLLTRVGDRTITGKGTHVWYNVLSGTCQTSPPPESQEVEWVLRLPYPWRRMWSWEASKWFIYNTRTEKSRWNLEGYDDSSAQPLVHLKVPPQDAADSAQTQQSQPSQLSQLSQPSQLSASQPAAVAVAAGSETAVPAVPLLQAVTEFAAAAQREGQVPSMPPLRPELSAILEQSAGYKLDLGWNPSASQSLAASKANDLSKELPAANPEQPTQLSQLSQLLQPSQLPLREEPRPTLSVAASKAAQPSAKQVEQSVSVAPVTVTKQETGPKLVLPKAAGLVPQQLSQPLTEAAPEPKAEPRVILPPRKTLPQPATRPLTPADSKGRKRYFYETAVYADQARQHMFCKRFNDDRGCKVTRCPELHGCDNMLLCGRPCSLPHARYAHELAAHGQLQARASVSCYTLYSKATASTL